MPRAGSDVSARLDLGVCATRGRYHTPHIPRPDQIPIDPPTCDITRVRSPRPRSRAPSAADLAQARLFVDILHTELAELQALAATIEARLQLHEQRSNTHLVLIQARMTEVRDLLDALENRFPTAFTNNPGNITQTRPRSAGLQPFPPVGNPTEPETMIENGNQTGL